ncbi:hypothetical protein [Paenibacillus soyae]|uniref:Uncharacterized protein n=1 Tax=Paenibacillus soyae TaxID=2969249 RepID=A0A9X2MU65_9BACL|nr:hypothetical protein [Paenibacillus soyae]MCR2806889.1 hypothetical protein [Paenibacillus soyae]
MDKDILQENNTLVSKDRFFVTIESIGYFEVKNEQLPLLVEKGKQATVGDYIRLIKEHYQEDAELTNITPYMEFRVKHPKPKGTRGFKVLRMTRDFTYRPVTKI